MKRIIILCFWIVILSVPGGAGAQDLQTVIVTPVAAPQNPALTGAARAELVAKLMDEAGRSQASLLTDLEVRARSARSVQEVHPLWIVNRVVVTATPAVIAELAKRSDVASIRAARAVRLVEPVVTLERGEPTYGVAKIRAPDVWSRYGIDGSGVLVGHLDTGVDANHPDLRGKVVKFKDFYGTPSTGFDGQGHGTHTAGSIAGAATSGKAIGVAPGARLIVGRIFNNSGTTNDAVILRSMNWMADPDGNPQTADAPRLVSCSWGGDKETNTSGGDLWNAAQHWMDLDILPVFAAGNSGPRERTVGTTAAFPHCLAVGATDASDGIASFSSRGPVTWDGKDIIKPDVCAPGARVESAKDGGGYVTHSGTSMACPHAAGIVALVLQANPNLRARQVVEILRSTTSAAPGTAAGNVFGWGRLDALQAVEKARAMLRFEQAGE